MFPVGCTVNILAWFVFVYFIRVLLSYVIRLSIAMRSIGKAFTGKNLVHIEPLHPDGAGGLAEFGGLAWRMTWLVLPIALYLVFWWYKKRRWGSRWSFSSGQDPAWS